MSSDESESYRENRRRRIAYFRNNWGTELQVDEEDNDCFDDMLKSPKSPLRSRRDSGCKFRSPQSSLINLNVATNVLDIPLNPWHHQSPLSPASVHKPSPFYNQQHVAITDSFCNCRRERSINCACGESDDFTFDWCWDEKHISKAAELANNNRDITFHGGYSAGTACVKGGTGLRCDQYFWEIKLTSPVYGTDMMIGVGTEHNDLNRNELHFCSMLGEDGESWGLSYTGTFHHNGEIRCYSPRLSQGSIVGVHLDMWYGTLSFYRNRQPLGVVCNQGLRGKLLFPMVCSTAAKTGMRLMRSKNFKSSLQYLCCRELRKCVPPEYHVLDVFELPPGLSAYLRQELDWLLMSSIPKGLKRQLNEPYTDRHSKRKK
ncbi:uncharacterized protein B4U79_11398 [Dinothrombium tinctorium]|uniref:SPRY domain-containing SOCS box protein 3 n=1 Tax=Dinothrombium tinctorium TaxID=1965070 RepID=A0A3S3P5G3_9ACAR|nr:uncharacterized protein B4U79_11398 [Dinothrombium tinctorium]